MDVLAIEDVFNESIDVDNVDAIVIVHVTLEQNLDLTCLISVLLLICYKGFDKTCVRCLQEVVCFFVKKLANILYVVKNVISLHIIFRKYIMIEVIDISKFSVKLKATIQKTGRLGFTKETADVIGCHKGINIKFARDTEDGNVFYMIIVPQGTSNSFEVCKAGQYYYVQTKLLFDSLSLDYKHTTIMFDMVRMYNLDTSLEGCVYKLIKRVRCKKQIEE